MDTKKLRQKILDLAIHGKLVPQDPNDEPASVLLERIRAEKERLIAEGKIKRSKKSATSDTSHYENVPFEVPEGWCWTTIGEVSSSILYGVSESAKETGAYKLLRITDIQDNKVDWDSVPYTDFTKDKALNYLLQDGDILFARTGATVGKSYLVSGLTKDSIYASYLIRVQTSQLIFPEYIKRFFESGYYWEQISLSSVGIGQPNVNGTTLANLNVPIPPYKEQLRIVEEANRWLAIADILDENTGHICKAIESAKAKILDLAIHGKLVPQDPNDEPAIELLKRINPKAVASCDNPHYEQIPFEIPDNWAWVRIDAINQFKSKTVNPQNYHSDQFELYSVPTFETGEPEFPYGKNIASSKVEVEEGDVLLCKINPHLNRVWVVRRRMSQLKLLASSEWIVIRTDEILPEYLALTMQSPYFRELMMSNVSGVGGSLMRAQPTFVKQYMIPIPPYNEQIRIVDKIQETFKTLDSIAESLN